MALLQWENTESFDDLRDKVNAIVDHLNGYIQESIPFDDTIYAHLDAYQNSTITWNTPDDGITRKYIVIASFTWGPETGSDRTHFKIDSRLIADSVQLETSITELQIADTSVTYYKTKDFIQSEVTLGPDKNIELEIKVTIEGGTTGNIHFENAKLLIIGMPV